MAFGCIAVTRKVSPIKYVLFSFIRTKMQIQISLGYRVLPYLKWRGLTLAAEGALNSDTIDDPVSAS